MQILKPVVRQTIWGGSNLTRFSWSTCNKIGHLYSVIDTKESCNEIIWGTHKHKTLHEWFLDNRNKYGLEHYQELPILMSLIDANENLSIQVHPDDNMATKLENMSSGKNESFYVIKAPICGKIYNGCKIKDIEGLKNQISQGNIDEAVDMISCEAGDYVYVTGGTLHAITAGSIVFEIEENCDKTYRLWDYDRIDENGNKRHLNLDEALACLDVFKQSTTTKHLKNTIIEERMYFSQHIANKNVFINNDNMFCFAVMIQGKKLYNDIYVLPGTAILLDAGEVLDISDSEWIITTPKKFTL